MVLMILVNRHLDRVHVTMTYASECFAIIKKGNSEADTAWFKANKRDIMIDHFRQALAVDPPPLANQQYVAVMQQFLREGENVLSNVDGEVKAVVEITILLAALYADVKMRSGGALTEAAIKQKLKELSAEAEDYGRFVEATSNIQESTLELIPFFLRWYVSNKSSIASLITLRVD